MKKIHRILFLALTTVLLAGCGGDSKPFKGYAVLMDSIMRVDTTANLLAFYPNYSKVDMVFGKMPRHDQEDVIFCCAAAFTGKQLKSLRHDNIAGAHAGGGDFHKGYPTSVNTGTFIYYNDKFEFLPQQEDKDIRRAARKGGMGFMQQMLFHKGKRMSVSLSGRERFRALASKDGRLCIIESRRLQDIGFFLRSLRKYGVDDAIYLVMGKGWNHSWYRDNFGDVHLLHPHQHDFNTNWLVCYK